jgi:hypothetical protein
VNFRTPWVVIKLRVFDSKKGNANIIDGGFAKQTDYVNIMNYYSWLKLHFLFVVTPMSNTMVLEVTLDIYFKIWPAQFWLYIYLIDECIIKYQVNI